MSRSIQRRAATIDPRTATSFEVSVPTTIEGIAVKRTIEQMQATIASLTARVQELERKTAALP
jgi:hypothetical protein